MRQNARRQWAVINQSVTVSTRDAYRPGAFTRPRQIEPEYPVLRGNCQAAEVVVQRALRMYLGAVPAAFDCVQDVNKAGRDGTVAGRHVQSVTLRLGLAVQVRRQDLGGLWRK